MSLSAVKYPQNAYSNASGNTDAVNPKHSLPMDSEKQSQCLRNSVDRQIERVSMSLWNIRDWVTNGLNESVKKSTSKPSRTRLSESLSEPLLDATTTLVEGKDLVHQEETILYLAYGSNLSESKFQGSRGIRPISSINVRVPSLDLTFDLPGLPYKEPCFANTRLRVPTRDSVDVYLTGEPHWTKGLIGVVYEVTKADFAKIIATEGGGASYKDILVDCYELDEKGASVTGSTLKAHTLYAPIENRSPARPDEDYAQPSARYLGLIIDGAAENGLPKDYQEYLKSIQPYTITSIRQQLGQILLLATWGPSFAFTLALSRLLADENGAIPQWLVGLTGLLFEGLWGSYDRFFKPIFGDGERTQKRSKVTKLQEKDFVIAVDEKKALLSKS